MDIIVLKKIYSPLKMDNITVIKLTAFAKHLKVIINTDKLS